MFADRVFETTTSTGTGTITLGGAQSGYRAYADAYANGAIVPYHERNEDGSIWESGWGVLDTSAGTITRNLLESSTGSLINWGSGTKYIYDTPVSGVLASLLANHIGTTRKGFLPAGALWPHSGNSLLMYYNGSADVAVLPLALGTAGQMLRVNSGATAPEYADYDAIIKGKHEIPIVARAMTPALTDGCAPLALLETTTNDVNIEYLAFDDASAESACFQFPAPKSSDETVGIEFRAIWMHPSASDNFGVTWSLQLLARGDDEAADTAYGTAQDVEDTGGTANDVYVTDWSSAVTPGGTWAEGDILFGKVTRDVADGGDTLAVDARLVAIVLRITVSGANDA